jgi:hypothetical protein
MNVVEFAADVSQHTPGLRVAEAEAYGRIFDRQLKTTVRREFVKLAGIPQLEGVGNWQALGRAIATIAKQPLDGNPRSIHLGHPHGSDEKVGGFMPVRTSQYDINGILIKLASSPQKSRDALARAIEQDLPDSRLRRLLAERYSSSYARAAQIAAVNGISASAFDRLVRENAVTRNRPMEQLYRPRLQERIALVIEEAKRTGNLSLIGDFIDQTVVESRRTWATDPYQAVIEAKLDPKTKQVHRRIYDARTDREFTD